jgi:hypothetical protein
MTPEPLPSISRELKNRKKVPEVVGGEKREEDVDRRRT